VRRLPTNEHVAPVHKWQIMSASLEFQGQTVDVLACTGAPAPTPSVVTSTVAQGDTGSATALAAQCDAKVAAACLALGAMYDEGKGVPRDEALAKKLYDRACQGGLATGCTLRDRGQH
jgi:hypothetical protein